MDFRDPILIPMPKTDDEFERLCLLIARERYGPEFYRYARRGQKQNGTRHTEGQTTITQTV